jgi:hypothetical protein
MILQFIGRDIAAAAAAQAIRSNQTALNLTAAEPAPVGGRPSQIKNEPRRFCNGKPYVVIIGQQLRHKVDDKAAKWAALFWATAKGVAEMPQETVIPSLP